MPRKYDLLGPFETTAQERLSPDEIAGWAEYTETEDDAPEMNPLTPEHGAAPPDANDKEKNQTALNSTTDSRPSNPARGHHKTAARAATRQDGSTEPERSS